MSLALAMAAVLNAQPTPAPCIPDLQAKLVAEAAPARPCSQPKPILMAFTQDAPVAPPTAERTPNLYRQPARCGPVGEEITRRIETSAPAQRMAAVYAVMREVDGCGVPTPVGYHPDYLAPGAADAKSAKPAGAPARKR